MSKMKRIVAMALALCMTGSLVFSNVNMVYAAGSEEKKAADASAAQEVEFEKVSLDEVDTEALKKNETETADDLLLKEAIDKNASVKVIIVMDGKSVVEKNSEAKLDDKTTKEMKKLEKKQDAVIEKIEKEALDGEDLEVSYQYTWLLNGVAATVPYSAIEDIRDVKGVKKVFLQPVYEICDTDAVSDISYPMTISDGEMIGRENTWAKGYTGEGLKIAIIDTGLDIDHQNFGSLAEDVEVTATPDTVAAVLGNLNASKRFEGLTIDDVYYSTKVAYGFNYCDNNLDITHDNDEQGDHGTHVAGIAAANKVAGDDPIGSQVTGVAPDAQLYVMKVFGRNGGAYTEDILAALEDAMILGADVANLSLGSPAGFTRDGEEIDKIYDRASKTGIILAIAGGNEYTSGYGNAWGTNENLTMNPDNATIASPAVYANALSVACMENAYFPSAYVSVNGKVIAYTDGDGAKNPPLASLAGQTFQMVAIPGNGEPEAYAGLDVTGKVVLVQRGEISFGEKATNAYAAGAAACLVYNNESGIINMSLEGSTTEVPCASITKADGDYILSALAEKPDTTLTVGADQQLVASPTASQMSDFSNWGVTPELGLEPDITAPGGNIYSTLNGGNYGLMSGTSMASPNLAGMAALVSEYVRETYGYSGTELHNMVKYLLMSTSVPVSYSEGLLYSPRKQGSGLANAYSAVTTQAYLTVEGCDTPKAELKDDPSKSGNYNYSFDVHNFGEKPLFYAMDTTAQTEGVDETYAQYGLYFMSATPRALAAATSESSDAMVLRYDVNDSSKTDSHDAYLIYQAAVKNNPQDANWQEVSFRYNTDNNETADAADVQAYLDALVANDSPADLSEKVMMVDAGKTATVNVNIALDAADREYFDTYYENGGYVEGFTLLNALNSNGVDLSLPYLAFYGDWTAAGVMDWGFYWQNEEEMVYNQYPNVLFSQYIENGEEKYPLLGANPYGMLTEEPIDLNHLSLSPNGDGYADQIGDAYISLLRNAAKLTLTYTDPTGEKVYDEETIEHVSKSVFSPGYGQVVPYVYSWGGTPGYDLKDENGEALPNNTKLLLTVGASIDYKGAPVDSWSVPITVDTEAPELLKAEIFTSNEGNKELKLTFRDNVSVAGVNMLDQMGRVYGQYGVADVEVGEDGYQTYTQTYDVTNCPKKLLVLIGDYAINESLYALNLNGAGNDYGNLVGFRYDEFGGNGMWVSFDNDVNRDEVEVFSSPLDFVCAEYVNGIVFAQTSDGKLYGFPYEDMLADTYQLEATYITTLDHVYQDFAYNYKDGNLYGLSTEQYNGAITAAIYSINLRGEYYDEDMWTTVEAYHEEFVTERNGLYGLTLACDDDGNFYVIGTVTDEETGEESGAQLWKIVGEDSEWGYTDYTSSLVGELDKNINYRQSMAWDHNTEKLYWAQFYPRDMLNFDTDLIEINPETAETTKAGTLTGETSCLFAWLGEEAAAKEAHQNVPVFDREIVGVPMLNKATMVLSIGQAETLSCTFDPWYSNYTDVTWSSDNEAVATVDENGTVTSVADGTCTITVASVKDPQLTATCMVTVTSLDLTIEGVTSVTTGGLNNVGATSLYSLDMKAGQSAVTLGSPITASDEYNFGLQLGCSTLAKGSMWACEYGNTGMIYQIDPATGVVMDVLEPVDGDVLWGLTYSENTGLFTAISNFDLYVDVPMTHEQKQEILDSYDEESKEFTWHRLRMTEYLEASDQNFNTGEKGNGSMTDVVFCGITTIDKPYTHEDTYKDYLGNWAYGGQVSYTSDATYVLLDNVGRLWYVDEIMGLQMDEWGEAYCNEDYTDNISTSRNGVMSLDNGDGTYNVFYLRKMEETPLTDMYRAGTMPRYTYHFSDLYYAGTTKTENQEGVEVDSDVFFMSLYDYWNEGATNQLYLYLAGTTGWNDIGEEIKIGQMLYDLGNMGQGNIISTINRAEVTGGIKITK